MTVREVEHPSGLVFSSEASKRLGRWGMIGVVDPDGIIDIPQGIGASGVITYVRVRFVVEPDRHSGSGPKYDFRDRNTALYWPDELVKIDCYVHVED